MDANSGACNSHWLIYVIVLFSALVYNPRWQVPLPWSWFFAIDSTDFYWMVQWSSFILPDSSQRLGLFTTRIHVVAHNGWGNTVWYSLPFKIWRASVVRVYVHGLTTFWSQFILVLSLAISETADSVQDVQRRGLGVTTSHQPTFIKLDKHLCFGCKYCVSYLSL